jgi:hypothetical protein
MHQHSHVLTGPADCLIYVNYRTPVPLLNGLPRTPRSAYYKLTLKPMISSRHLRYQYQIFQNFKPVAIVAVPVDERKKLGGGSEQDDKKTREHETSYSRV